MAVDQPPADTKAWLNRACELKPTKETADRYLTDLEMRLHLAGEDLDSALEEDSGRALEVVRGVARKLASLQTDVRGFNGEVQRVLGRLESSAITAEQSVSLLAQLDTVRTNVEAASQTLKGQSEVLLKPMQSDGQENGTSASPSLSDLREITCAQEATELAEVFGKVDRTFGSGSLEDMAALLGTMRRGVSLVGNVPEFEGGTERVKALQDRFFMLLEPELVSAIAQKQGEKMRQLTGYLIEGGKTSMLSDIFVQARLPAMQHVWEILEGAWNYNEFAKWMHNYCETIVAAAGEEAAWVAAWLPEGGYSLVRRLLHAFFVKIEPAMHRKVASVVNPGSPEISLLNLAILHLEADSMVKSFQQHLNGMSREESLEILECACAPIDNELWRYTDIEQVQLSIELDDIKLATTAVDTTEAFVAGLEQALPHAVESCRSAADRCWECTSGTNACALVSVVDVALGRFITRLTALVREHAEERRIAVTTIAATGEAAAFLGMLHVAQRLKGHLLGLSEHLQGRLLSISPRLEQASQPTPSVVDLMYIRLHRAQVQQAGLLSDLQEAVARASNPAVILLEQSNSSTAVFTSTIHNLIYDLLMAKLHAEFAPLPGLSTWSETVSESELDLPSFSAYPQAYATAAGEYLMMLPQILETLLAPSDVQRAEASNVDADAAWLDWVAEGAAEVYVQQLMQIPQLSQRGSKQLAADLEYFCNVLSALGVPVPSPLATWRNAAQWPNESFHASAQAAADDAGFDGTIVRYIARCRSLELPKGGF